jgi:hypothetical protein
MRLNTIALIAYWVFFISYGLWPSTTPDNLSLQMVVSLIMLSLFLMIQLNGVLISKHTAMLLLLFSPMFALSIVGLSFNDTTSALKDLIFIFCLTLPFLLALLYKYDLDLHKMALAPVVAGGLLATQNIFDYSSNDISIMFVLLLLFLKNRRMKHIIGDLD